jgi:hypothetical protein
MSTLKIPKDKLREINAEPQILWLDSYSALIVEVHIESLLTKHWSS